MSSDVAGPPSFLRYATVSALVTILVGLGVVGIYTKNTGGGQSVNRDIYCWKSGSGNGLCINEMGGVRMSGSLTTQSVTVNSGATTTWTRSAPNVSLITSSDYVGIGTATPKGKLTVFGSGAFTGTVSGATLKAMTTLASSGQLLVTSTVRFSSGLIVNRSTDLGWSVVSVANQACNTTCTYACVFGEDTSVLGTFVSCSDATADKCLCAGGN